MAENVNNKNTSRSQTAEPSREHKTRITDRAAILFQKLQVNFCAKYPQADYIRHCSEAERDAIAMEIYRSRLNLSKVCISMQRRFHSGTIAVSIQPSINFIELVSRTSVINSISRLTVAAVSRTSQRTELASYILNCVNVANFSKGR